MTAFLSRITICSTLIALAFLATPLRAADSDDPFEARRRAPYEEWRLPDNPPSWARNPEGFSCASEPDQTLDGRDSVRILHKTETDWAVRIPVSIDVKKGDVFRLKWKIRNPGASTCAPGVILYDAEGNAISWNYGGKHLAPDPEWREGESPFVVPDGVARIEPRIIGQGDTELYVAEFSLLRTGRLAMSEPGKSIAVESKYLTAVFDGESPLLTVTDRRTGRVWKQTPPQFSPFVLKLRTLVNGVEYDLFDGQSMTKYRAVFRLERDAPEIAVEISADPETELSSPLGFPAPFATAATDRVVLPINEGISFPATENPPGLGEIHTYGGHGLCMAFWGVTNDSIEPGSGLMGIVETPHDAAVDVRPRANDDGAQTLSIAPRWRAVKGTFGYDRKMRYVFLDSGGHVAMCKRYRKYARQIGLLCTFEDKIRDFPALEEGLNLLKGAANIWNWDGRGPKTIPVLKELGFERILWSAAASADEIKEMNAMPGVLTSRYDIYQDVMNPERYGEIEGVHPDWIPEAWPQDLAWDAPGHWTRGWEIDAKDRSKPRIPCGVLCDSRALEYAKKRIGDELKVKPYKCRFLDTTVASPWRECWSPDHPMTRSECCRERMKLLDLVHQFGLVCGSETGIDASVPFCDYYEGMESLGPYRCPDSGRYLVKLWDEIPDVVEKYQLGETYRLPLFELVYHDCVVAYWYWGDHNMKFPALLRKRDLFNALYGTPPMYGFTCEYLNAHKEEFAASIRRSGEVANLAGFEEMTDHVVLTEDRRVQKSVFAGGLEVVVNFRDEEYRFERDGETVVIPPTSAAIFK